MKNWTLNELLGLNSLQLIELQSFIMGQPGTLELASAEREVALQVLAMIRQVLARRSSAFGYLAAPEP